MFSVRYNLKLYVQCTLLLILKGFKDLFKLITVKKVKEPRNTPERAQRGSIGIALTLSRPRH